MTSLPEIGAALTLVFVSVISFGCQNVSFRSGSVKKAEVPEKPVPSPGPSARPVLQSSTPQVSPSPSPVPTTVPSPSPAPPVSLKVLRSEQDSWFKICLWITVNGQKREDSLLGCNKGPQKIGSVGPVNLNMDQGQSCPMLGLQAEVYKNARNCFTESDCPDESYPKAPSFTRMIPGNNSSAMSPFLLRKHGDQAPLDSRVSLTPELVAAEGAWNGASPRSGVDLWRVFVEDQSDESFAQALSSGGSWESFGIDYNDVVFDLELRAGQPFAGFGSCAP